MRGCESPRRRSLALAGAAFVAGIGRARASEEGAGEPWASGVGRIVVPRAVGGTGDLLARAVAEYFGRSHGQRFVVENHPEAAGANAVRKVAGAAPDGLTLLSSDFASLLAAPVLQPRLEVDPVSGMDHLALLADAPLLLVTHPGSVASSVAELLGRESGASELFCATAGVGSNGHLVCERLRAAGARSLVHLPYRGAAQAASALLSRETTHAVLALGSALPFLVDGRMHPMAVTSLRRVAGASAIATFEELGLGEITFTNWYGLSGPSGLPEAVRQKIRNSIMRWLGLDATRQMFESRAMQARPLFGRQLLQFIESERARWTPLLRDAMGAGRR